MKIGNQVSYMDEELVQVKHHFIGHLSVQDYYSIGQYEEDVLRRL